MYTDTTPLPPPDTSDAPAAQVNPNGVDLARKAGFPKDHKDARIAKVAAAETSGEYGAAHDPSNPQTLERLQGGAFLSSTQLHGGA